MAQPTLGEAFVTGVGLIGLLTVVAVACAEHVFSDFDEAKLEVARFRGAETCNPDAGKIRLSWSGVQPGCRC